MTKYIALLLAFAIALTFAACGAAEAPAAAEKTDAPAAVQTQAQEKNPVKSTVITGAEESMAMLRGLGYLEVVPEKYAKEIATYTGNQDASVTPTMVEVTGRDFRMELDTKEYFYSTSEVRQTAGWVLYGTKGSELQAFVDLESQGYQLFDYQRMNDTFENSIFRMAEYTYYRLNKEGFAEAMAVVTAAYYPGSGNLYNVVQEYTELPEQVGGGDRILAWLVDEIATVGEVETVQWDEHTIELHRFAIQCGSDYYIYQYRPGMSLSDWACSELNVDGWIPWYGDMVYSPDLRYSCSTGYLDIGEIIETMHRGDMLLAEEFDGNLNHINMNGGVTEFTPFASDGGTGTSVFTDTGAIDETALQEFLAQNGLDDGVPVTVVTNAGDTGAASAGGVINSITSEENAKQGNIPVPVAHMVNARTPLMSPGFRIISKHNGLAAYHSVDFGYGDYLLDDVLDIYMNGIEDSLIPHVKLYAFPESDAFLQTLEGQTILDVHPTPFAPGHEMLKIPDDALCLTFQRVSDGQEAPNTPNSRRPGHENLNKDAVYARYVTKNDPNFGEGVNLVFAITYDDELVYWIHMGSNFKETSNAATDVPMGY